MMRPDWLTEQVLKVVLSLLLVVAVILWVRIWLHGHDKALAEESRTQTNEAVEGSTQGMIQDGKKADQDRSALDYGVAGASNRFENDYQGAKEHDQDVSDYAGYPVPGRVRDAFRERRLERERLARAAEERRGGSPASGPPER